jgi:lipid-A-disaccharide synthase
VRIGIIVAEASGDKLAASILKSWQQLVPDLQVQGILGPACQALGFQSWFPMERLSVMGLIEPLKRLPELFQIRRQCLKQFLKNPPDCFIGVDAPDFTLSIEKILRQTGIPTVHVVSPSVWAWRPGRIKKIKAAVSLMLPLFPFEQIFYEKQGVPVHCIGHPLADSIPLTIDTASAKKALGLEDKTVIALLPGSRDAELRFLLTIYLQAAERLLIQYPDVQFVMPVVSEQHKQQVEDRVSQLKLKHLPLDIRVQAMSVLLPAADAVLVTSGTATLEVMLYKKPMVIAYKTDSITYHIIKRLIKVPYIGLPNLLANIEVVPELIQDLATPENCAEAIVRLLKNDKTALVRTQFTQIHQQLKRDAALQAVQAITLLLTN